ncbi:glutathione hydrolase 1 proenzyme [Gadus macrocephalus]|uniref:glutathione hydrolase 1 proenzyme n=1 Tax=Gadus macrocephalus TaxID=80720 RepID=UPI0028CB923C|nr:glutathione hydrolase 1 proenzyme [Gadus macrocephalus]
MVSKTVVLALALLLVAAAATFLGVFFGVSSPSEGGFSRAAVAADAGLCSEIGRDMLQKGGSAVDAMISSLLCVGIVNPHSAGIGGGLFITIYNGTTGTVETIDGREVAPGNATENMFGTDKDLSRTGGLAIAVPGEIRAFEMAHQRHGKLPWRDLFQPCIELAKNGFPMGSALAGAIKEYKDAILKDQALCAVFCGANGTLLKENDTVKNLKLAETYRRISEEGADAFYVGPMAEALVKDIQAKDGIVTLEDLRDYRPVLDENPLKVNIGGYTMVTPSAPASGPVLSLLLLILEGYSFSAKSVSSPEARVLTYHRVVEAFRFAYAKRTLLGDRHFLNITDLIQNMTSTWFARGLRDRITDNTTHHMNYYEPEFYMPDDAGTSHLSIVSEDGSAVAATSTINTFFGSKVMSSTGILLNNEMDDFSSPNITNAFDLPPSPRNFIRPGKRPMSSMVPTILLDKDNRVKMVVGGSGGSKITTAIAQVILKALYFNFDLRTAVGEARLHNQLSPNATTAEPGFDMKVLEGLALKNHETKALKSTGAVIQAVVRHGNRLHAQSDPRKGGYAAGY